MTACIKHHPSQVVSNVTSFRLFKILQLKPAPAQISWGGTPIYQKREVQVGTHYTLVTSITIAISRS
jgi:predicted O-linked N-acetylglucosamine transferase (SPINDLY family)